VPSAIHHGIVLGRHGHRSSPKVLARRLVVELGEELRYAVEEHPGDPGVVLARKFYDELIADHPWLAA
jgi:hypothetical protein